MKTIALMLAGALCVASDVVIAADSPAQAGYCMQHLRNVLKLVDETLQAKPLEADDSFLAMQRQMDAKLRSLFDQWRLYGLSLPTTDLQVSTEFLRGAALANIDMQNTKSQSDAQMSECKKAQAAAPPGVDAMSSCLIEKQKAEETDPTTAGIRARIAPCMRGPSL
jgi:hypothetical protein